MYPADWNGFNQEMTAPPVNLRGLFGDGPDWGGRLPEEVKEALNGRGFRSDREREEFLRRLYLKQ